MKAGRFRAVTEWVIVFVVAVIVWLFVISEQNPTMDKTVAVSLKYKNVGDGLVVVNPKNDLRISVTASRDRINEIRAANFQAVVDLKGLHEGNHTVRATVSGPEKIEISDDGGEFVVRLEPAIERQVPLDMRKVTENARPYLVKEIAKPDKILIRGAKEDVLSVARAVVDVEMDKLNSTTTMEVTPKLYSAGGDIIDDDDLQMSPNKVVLNITMYAERSIKIEPQTIGKLSRGRMQFVPAEAKLFGDGAQLSAVHSIAMEPVDLLELSAKDKMIFHLIIPPGLFLSPGQGKFECLYAKDNE